MPISYRRSRFLWCIIFCLSVAQVIQLTIVGCNHTAPYYHAALPTSQKADTEVHAALAYRVLLLGDGGAPKTDEPVLRLLSAWAKKAAERTSIVFLGDNMYPEGMTERKRDEASVRLVPQLAVIKASGAHGLFIPGNHDWANGKSEGYDALLAQEQFINKALHAHHASRLPNFLPTAGHPGPVAVDLPQSSPLVRLIVLDTQWWLHKGKKLDIEPGIVIQRLEEMLNTDLPLLVLGHHPLETYGAHGGFREWQAHLFALRDLKNWLWIPTPIIGSLYHFARWAYKSEQDMSGTRNKNMVQRLNSAFSTHDKTQLSIYAAGHEHALQVLKGNGVDYLLVSGAASSRKVTAVTDGTNTLFAHAHPGFMTLDFLTDGTVLLRVVVPAEKSVEFHYWLKR